MSEGIKGCEILKCGISRNEWHDKAWTLFHTKKFEDAELQKVNIHTIRAVFDATYDALTTAPEPSASVGMEPVAEMRSLAFGLAIMPIDDRCDTDKRGAKYYSADQLATLQAKLSVAETGVADWCERWEREHTAKLQLQAKLEQAEKDAARWRFSMEYQGTVSSTPDSRCEAMDEMWSAVFADHRLHPSRDEYEAAIDKAMLAEYEEKK